jgi:hypothetical protein
LVPVGLEREELEHVSPEFDLPSLGEDDDISEEDIADKRPTKRKKASRNSRGVDIEETGFDDGSEEVFGGDDYQELTGDELEKLAVAALKREGVRVAFP